MEFQENNNNNQNPDGQAGTTPKTYSEEEYKNLQAFGTKANQGLIDMSKKLVEKEPKELLSLDPQLQNKIIKDLYGYDNIEELKVMLPDLFENNEENKNDNSDALIQVKREQELLKMKLNRKEVDDEIEKISFSNPTLVNSVPNFKEKVMEELKYISSELPIKDRVDRATKLISGNNISVEAYLQLQGRNYIKSNSQGLTDDYIKDAQNKFRASLGLKQK